MVIREYTSSDFDGCMQILHSNIPEYFHAGDLAEFERFLKHLPGPFFVVFDQSENLVACGGIALGRNKDTEAVLCYGMVGGQQLRQGIGRELLRQRLEYFLPQQPQIEFITVNTTQKTEGFFRKFGFNVVEREVDGFGPGLDRVRLSALKGEVTRLLAECPARTDLQAR